MSDTYVTQAWSCTVRLVVGDRNVLGRAARDLDGLLARVDGVASRFRDDSVLVRVNRLAGRPVPVPALLVDLVAAALEAASATEGAVDPTVGLSMRTLGYDRDIAAVLGHDVPGTAPKRAGGWRAVRLDRRTGLLTVPCGFALDLGATAKAWTADHAARSLAARYDTPVLVELGGDVAVGGPARPWLLRVAEREGGDGQIVTLPAGGLATSTTTVRTWHQAGADVHHIVDPTTGRPADGPWRTASVAADSALQANFASTAAIVKGTGALAWLATRGVAARLVAQDGSVTTVGAWPRELAGVA